ncbi:MAG: substrate-binding domain-containing protein [Bacteroidales bacterium]|nr:substrate-binding domain-containing protein [Bacteroidales bacterium]
MKAIHLLSATLLILTAISCNKAPTEPPRFATDEVYVAIDETFKPIMQEEVFVFNAQHTTTNIHTTYTTETEAINLLLKDSIRLIVATRPLSESETKTIKRHKLNPRQQIIGYDALALIVNRNNPDTAITLAEVKRVMQGELRRWEQLGKATTKGDIQVVFDNQSSSTVRYVRDSLNGGAPLGKHLTALKSNQEVIDFIKDNPRSIGVVGADWVKNPKDTSKISFDPSIRVMLVSRGGEGAEYVRPYQYHIATGSYPLVRSVWMILTDPMSSSMTRNFFQFVGGNDGQLILVKNSQLLPKMPVQVKDVNNRKGK